MKRFYKLVATHKEQGGYTITLDGRPVKTPLKAALKTPSEAIASAIQREWAEQGDEIVPDSMPITQILNTQIDKVEKEREAMQELLLKYLDTDLLCYRTDHPPSLRQVQDKAWDPYLIGFEKKFGTKLEVTDGLTALTQPPEAHKAVREYVESLDAPDFTLLQLVSPLCGSVVMGLSFVEKELSAEDMFKAMRVEENFKAEIYNEEFYGQDPAQESKDKAIQRDLAAAQTYRDLLD